MLLNIGGDNLQLIINVRVDNNIIIMKLHKTF